jgi:hypothetical protein
MRTIHCWRELEPYGIDPLTGEACGLSCRILFDCTENGRKILAKALGIPGLKLAEPWNGGTKDDPHVGSILLPQEMLTLVSVFALLESGSDEVWQHEGGVIGFEPGDSRESRGQQLDWLRPKLVRRYAYQGGAGSRHQHMMSGRIE